MFFETVKKNYKVTPAFGCVTKSQPLYKTSIKQYKYTRLCQSWNPDCCKRLFPYKFSAALSVFRDANLKLTGQSGSRPKSSCTFKSSFCATLVVRCNCLARHQAVTAKAIVNYPPLCQVRLNVTHRKMVYT